MAQMTDLLDTTAMPAAPSADAYLLVEDIATGVATLMTLEEIGRAYV